MDKRGLLGSLILVGILLVVGFFWFVDNVDKNGSTESHVNESCVRAECCHASSCVWESEAPDCGEVFCTMECRDGTMDCGAGHCGVVDGECEVVWDE